MGYTANEDGTFSPPPANPIPEPTAKEIRDIALNNLEYDYGDGRVMQVRPKDEQNIRNAIELMTSLNMPTIAWSMKDNSTATVTVAELQTALQAGQLAAMQVWVTYTGAQ